MKIVEDISLRPLHVVLLCKYAFEELGMNRVQIKCAVGNTPSSNIPKRLGFQFEGIERAGELFAEGNFVDIEVYSLLKNEQEARHNLKKEITYETM